MPSSWKNKTNVREKAPQRKKCLSDTSDVRNKTKIFLSETRFKFFKNISSVT
jgi:hypothetical protein